MKYTILSVYDKELECFGKPSYETSTPDVIATSMRRGLKVAEKDEVKKLVNKSFYQLGEFDDEKGEMKLLEKPLLLVDCDEVLKARKDVNIIYVDKCE